MCHWSKGIELKTNISILKKWLNENKLHDSGSHETLEPLIQASQLLQARKSNSDIESVCDICTYLSISQIQRILYMYTPIEVYEEKLSPTFIDQVVNTLKAMRVVNETNTIKSQQMLTLDEQKQFPIYIPFDPSSIRLETLEIPEAFNLKSLLIKI